MSLKFGLGRKCFGLQEEIDMYYDANSISVSGRDPPKPALSFEEINFSSKLKLYVVETH